jgi:RimJ/RimL family protein N-acetyltransferase
MAIAETGVPFRKPTMAGDPSIFMSTWRDELPTLSGRLTTLREITGQDLRALLDLISLRDSARFTIDGAVSDVAVHDLIERSRRDRASGTGFLYAITAGTSRTLVGAAHVRQLDPAFEAAEWQFTVAPGSRGTGVFLESARLVGSFAFGIVGVHRLEARVPIQNGRANGALRKLGAVQEGVLRRSLRRNGDYLDQVLWSVLKEDWADHWMSTAPRVH